MRRAKIAATLGPACDRPELLRRMVAAGVDVARINFSHGDADDHRRRVERLREAAGRVGKPVALLADLQGPRFRVGELPGGALTLKSGAAVELVAGTRRAAEGRLPVSYAALARDVGQGDRILIDDGKIELRVERVRDERVTCAVKRGGVVRDRKGINLPGVELSVPALTRKDRADLELAVGLGADWLAVSFVRAAGDVTLARRLTKRAGRELPVMAKIERPEAIERLDAILEAADGLLVARGDLGVELPAEEVPILQKRIIESANRAGKPVMTATQMLESMRHSARPTRAEASDVANAVLDGSGCLLLTAETAVGDYPLETIRTMARIVESAERSGRTHLMAPPDESMSVPLATARAGCRAAYDVGARYVVAFTQSGFSARQAARFRPDAPILAFTTDEGVARTLALSWGVTPFVLAPYRTIEEMMRALDRELLERRLARRKELVVVLSGSPVGVRGTTNLIKVHRVGDAL